MYDLIIKNGRLFDPGSGLDRLADLAVSDGVIAETGDLGDATANSMVDAAGCYVTPGLTDYHAHIFFGGSEFSTPADIMALPNGVVRVVDGGTAGCAGFEALYRNCMVNSCVEVKAMLNLCTIGQPSHFYLEDQDPKLVNVREIRRLCEKYKGAIVAIKLRQSKFIVGDNDLEPLRTAVMVAEQVGLRVVVHASDSPGEIRETLDLLRPGDVFCHVYHQRGQTILGEDGKVRPELFAARERGILFDMAHGSMQFSGKVARAAIEQGFLPDIVSSDLSALSHCKAPTYSFSYVMAELLNLGMDFGDIVTACTTAPSRLLGAPNRDFLVKEKPANLAVLRLVERPVSYVDKYGNRYAGDRLIKPEITIVNGQILFRQYDNFNVMTSQ